MPREIVLNVPSIKETLLRVKTHLSENKEVYIMSGVCLAVGAMVFNNEGSNSNTQKVMAFKTGDISNTVVQNVVRRGHPGTVVFDPVSGEQYASISRAAKVLEVSRATVKNMIDDGRLVDLGDAEVV